jgi:hypothetical protein
MGIPAQTARTTKDQLEGAAKALGSRILQALLACANEMIQ